MAARHAPLSAREWNCTSAPELTRKESAMGCDVETLREVPLFSLLDDEELSVLAEQVELVHFAPRQRIYRIGDPGERAYVLIAGAVNVTTIDEDNQDVVVDQPARGDFFGLASMLDRTSHQTTASALEA